MIKAFSRYYHLFIYLFFISNLCASDEVLIITHVHSRPDFIKAHYDTFNAFLEENFKYVVFNDAPNSDMRKKIDRTCRDLGIPCYRVPDHSQQRQNPNSRHCDGIKYSLDVIGLQHSGKVMIIDSDMFLIKPFSVNKYMEGYDFVGGYQYRSDATKKITYTSPCLVFMDMAALPNKLSLSFESGYIEGLACDVGAHTYYYFRDNPTLKMRFYEAVSTHLVPRDEAQLRTLGYDDGSINMIFALSKAYGMEYHGDGYFLHYYGGGSNWPGYGEEYLRQKNELLYTYISNQISRYPKIAN